MQHRWVAASERLARVINQRGPAGTPFTGGQARLGAGWASGLSGASAVGTAGRLWFVVGESRVGGQDVVKGAGYEQSA